MKSEKRKMVHRFLEFLLIGLVMGIAEDLIAVKLSTGVDLDLSVILVVTLVAVPFAAFSELIVDKEKFNFGLIEEKVSKFFESKD